MTARRFKGRKIIVTENDCPDTTYGPALFTWEAHFDDPKPDDYDYGQMFVWPVGRGATEQEAVQCFKDLHRKYLK